MTLEYNNDLSNNLAKHAETNRICLSILREQQVKLQRRIDVVINDGKAIERARNRLRKSKSRRITGRN